MRAVHGRRYGDLSYAVGGYSDASRDGEQTKWKPDMKAIRATIDFVLRQSDSNTFLVGQFSLARRATMAYR